MAFSQQQIVTLVSHALQEFNYEKKEIEDILSGHAHEDAVLMRIFTEIIQLTQQGVLTPRIKKLADVGIAIIANDEKKIRREFNSAENIIKNLFANGLEELRIAKEIRSGR